MVVNGRYQFGLFLYYSYETTHVNLNDKKEYGLLMLFESTRDMRLVILNINISSTCFIQQHYSLYYTLTLPDPWIMTFKSYSEAAFWHAPIINAKCWLQLLCSFCECEHESQYCAEKYAVYGWKLQTLCTRHLPGRVHYLSGCPSNPKCHKLVY